MVCSAHQLILGDENIGMTKRFISGIRVNRETLAGELIDKIGPGGHYLEDEHTYRHFKNELWHPSLMTRVAYEEWESLGAKDMAARIQEKLDAILEDHTAPALPDNTLTAIKAIREKGVAGLEKK